MKKTILIITIMAVGIAAFGLVSTATAQGSDPVYSGNGNGKGNGRGDGTGEPMDQNINLDGLLDEYMAEYIANELGITVEELKAREAAGETLMDIGLSLGFDEQAILDIHTQARIAAINQAVADGLITQEQADWLLSRMENGQNGGGAGDCTEDCTDQNQQSRQGSGGK